ncbi:MAG: alpha/beta fold hydrolase [Bacteroidales bacterium]|nr:alpha/beta fold hydrolase [Bacteroidales bacterium]
MNIRRLLLTIILAFILILSWIFFIPNHYEVPAFVERPGTQYWELNTGSRIGYTKIESSSDIKGSPVIYLHGGPGGIIRDEVIEALRPLLQQGHDLYFYDQIGSGHSVRLDDISQYTVQRHKADLAEIIEVIHSEKVILIAHSWGCLLAINYIQDYPDKVEKMILEGPGPILPINKKLKFEVPPDSLNLRQPELSNAQGNQKAHNLRSRLFTKWAYLFKSKLASDREADNFFTYLNQELNKSTFYSADHAVEMPGGGGYYAHIMTVKSFNEVPDKRDMLKEIDIPVLILKGQCDNQPWGYTREYLDLLPNAKLRIIENSGHDLVNGNRAEYVKLVGEFILDVNLKQVEINN